MKAFVFYTTTGDDWELCGGSYLIVAESEEEAHQIMKPQISNYCQLEKVEEIDLTVKGLIEIQFPVVE